MVTLHLVRHARSAQDPVSPSWAWPLAAGSEAGAARLRESGVLPTGALWVSSTETKAVSTARLLTSTPICLDDAFREALRDAGWLGTHEFHRAVLRSFAHPDRPARAGWEPLAVTRDRVLGAARAVLVEAGDREVVLVGHGAAWTMLVSTLTGEPPDVAAWKSMHMPDHCALAWSGRITSPWGSWRA